MSHDWKGGWIVPILTRRCRWLIYAALASLFPGNGIVQETTQVRPGSTTGYTLQVPVDEISLTFHAYFADGMPLTQLTPTDLRIVDAGKVQTRIVMLKSYQDLPIRAGFLFDTSASMREEVERDRSIIKLYASRLLRRGVDRAFVMQFDTDTLMRQNWTDHDASIAAGAATVAPLEDRFPVTAIFDSLYRTCRDEWPKEDDTVTGNFILLFTDGVDDASHVYLSEAVDMCQRTRTAIYAITDSPKSHFSEGQKVLEELVRKSGGRIFYHPDDSEIWEDLRLIEAEQRNQFRLIYKPTDFKPDRSFHSIKLKCSIQGARILVRTGYYAFPRP